MASRDPGTPPRLLTIAGSDSGGGAGIQADLKTFSAFETYGMSVITAITAQNTLGVKGVEGITPAMVSQQLEAVVSDIGVDAIKTGMLYSSATIAAIISSLSSLYPTASSRPPIVVDPVCVSTSGHSLFPIEALDSLRNDFFPYATVITPNVPEGELLAGLEAGSIKTVEDMLGCAKLLGKMGARWVYLKGGHLPLGEGAGKHVVDVLWDSVEEKEIVSERPFLEQKNTHGTGCTLSSAIAAELANGKSVPEAVRSGADYVARAIATAYPLGSGSGPVHHFHLMGPRSLPLPTKLHPTPFTDYLRNYDRPLWESYVNHPFPNGLASGKMPLPSFLHFIEQDYHFLKQYGRTNALAAYKTENMEEMAASIVIVDAVVKETEMHVAYCEKYGISRAQLMAVEESVANLAYNRYVLDISQKGDLLDNRVVTAPCLLGYGEAGLRLVNASEGVDRNEETNPYWGWIKEYGGDWYQGAVKTGIDLLEKTVAESPISPARLEECCKIFQQATKLEVNFWDAAIEAEQTRGKQ
ncbi:Phosphomethylpyrimidine kinase-domain-containing protein [Leucosporidium creatinivorum]|uniref:Phosphomethylpyrimidine kinase-domain-containing protein n=1 Tax=Leucosporidium creatinivorum TaxID=106004 RepID=A0A1Y2F3U0_9BASI|nr:Phosphomethylpyrimidine kinase-domain-containing protein [Leucosporidium creatinivorum]